MRHRRNGLRRGARLSLFIVSYLPMFTIMVFRQLYTYREWLHFGGFSRESISNFLRYFGAVAVLGVFCACGIIGLAILLKNIARRTASSGDHVKVVDVENKNSETMAYLFTYVIPFVFQDLSRLDSVIPVAILLVVTYAIYRNSTLILINPTISMWYGLYLVEYVEGTLETRRRGMLITRTPYLQEDDHLLIKRIGHKLFYAQTQEDTCSDD